MICSSFLLQCPTLNHLSEVIEKQVSSMKKSSSEVASKNSANEDPEGYSQQGTAALYNAG
jgi:hypothetical protein